MYNIVRYEDGHSEQLGESKSLSAARFVALRASGFDSTRDYAIEAPEFAYACNPVYRDGQLIQGTL